VRECIRGGDWNVGYVSVVSSPSSATSSALSPDQLAKAWLLGVVDRTPLDRVGELDLERLASEAMPVLADALDRLEGTSPNGRRHPRLEDAAQALAKAFGSLDAVVAGRLIADRRHAVSQHGPAALPGSADLEKWLGVLVAQHRRYGSPFALALLELDGLGRIVERHGRRPGELMAAAATTVIRSQIRVVDHAFQVDDDAFCVLAPNVDAARLRRMADRLARVVDGSQATDAPRIAISAGVSGCPEHGQDSGRLLAVAEDALGAAKAAGEPVQVAASNGARC
jgi:diguanylate cyclase (GGDEF)-like protein